jgi:hypothetical protein
MKAWEDFFISYYALTNFKVGELDAVSNLFNNLELTDVEKEELYGKIFHCHSMILFIDNAEDYDSYMISEEDVTNVSDFLNSSFRDNKDHVRRWSADRYNFTHTSLSTTYMMNIGEDFSNLSPREERKITRAEAEKLVAELAELYHIISVEYDDDYFDAAAAEAEYPYNAAHAIVAGETRHTHYSLAYTDSLIRLSQDIPGFCYQDAMSKRGNIDRLVGTIKDCVEENRTVLQKLSDLAGLPPFAKGGF